MRACTSAFAPTSTPRVGSSRMRTLGSSSSHFASSTFCWLPPDRLATGADDRRRPDPQTLLVPLRRSPLLGSADEPEPRREAVEARQGDVRADGLRAARGRSCGGPRARRRCRAPTPARATGWRPFALHVGSRPPSAGTDAEQRLGDLRAPGADQTGEAEHLPFTDVEGDTFERTCSAEVLDLQCDVPRLVRHAAGRSHRAGGPPSPTRGTLRSPPRWVEWR